MTSKAPQIQRVRHELRLRRLQVVRVQRLAPKLARITLQGEELRGFTALGFDDHVKVFFPGPDGQLRLAAPGPGVPQHADGEAAPVMRDFTPRAFDSENNELSIDFYLHGQGPAAKWAAQAAPGQVIGVGGPRGSTIIPVEDIDTHVLIGDETALPAIERRLEELSPGAKAIVVAVVEAGDELPLHSRATLKVMWIARDDQQTSAEQVISTLRTLDLPIENCFVWSATETQSARAIRRYLIEERRFDKSWIKSAGYWQRGAEGKHVVVED